MGFITSALGGSILGGILSLLGKWMDVYTKGKEADIEIRKATAIASLKVKEAEMQAFGQSLKSGGEETDYNPDPLPENAPKWAMLIRITMESLRVFVDAFRTFTRPGLTWAMVLSLVVFIMAGRLGPLAVEAVVADFVFTTSTAVMWWFGSRPMSRTK